MPSSHRIVAPLLVAASSMLSHALQPQIYTGGFVTCTQTWRLRVEHASSVRAATCRRVRLMDRPICSMEGSKRKKKMRVDELLIEQGLARDEKEVKALVMTRAVIAGENVVIKSAAEKVASDTEFRLRGQKTHPWVSRGGVKLAHAVEHFGVDLKGAIAIDVGCSHGGFTDVLLHHGAKKVYAVDVGYGQLDLKLRNDESVVVLERTNARHLTAELVPDTPSLVVCDASFIPLSKVLPAALALCKPPARLLALIKPQFEATAEEAGAGKGVITDPAVRERTCTEVQAWLREQGWVPVGLTPSPIKGPSGNQEFIVHALLEANPTST